jgi:hypothetical protein
MQHGGYISKSAIFKLTQEYIHVTIRDRHLGADDMTEEVVIREISYGEWLDGFKISQSTGIDPMVCGLSIAMTPKKTPQELIAIKPTGIVMKWITEFMDTNLLTPDKEKK